MDFSSTAAISDWETYLKGMTPCRFPRFIRTNTITNTTADPLSHQISSAPVDIEQPDKLQELSTTDPDGLGAVLRTAWAVLLRCYTGQDDVSFSYQQGGIRNSNGDDGDDSKESPSRVGEGPVVVARFVLDDSAPLDRTVGRAKAELAGDLPPLPTRLFRSDHSDQQDFDSAIALWGVTVGSAPCPVLNLQQHKIRFLATRERENLTLSLEWSSSLLCMPEAQGALVASTLGKILSGILSAAPDAPLSSLDCVSQTNLDKVCEWNAGYDIPPIERCVHDVVADQIAERPDAEAVCAWDGSLTYRELDIAAGRLAAKLVGLGVGPEVFVPLCFGKSKWTQIAVLAVLRAGGAFVPLDPSHPVERLRGLCVSVGAKLMLCSGHLSQTLAGVVNTVLPLDDSTIAEAPEPGSVSMPPVSPTNAAYVIFTSGSTGQPKGTVIEHRAFCSSARSHASMLRIAGRRRVLQFAAHTFDASLVEILTPLMDGGCVCVPSEYERLNDLAGAMNRMRVDHAVLTPSFVNFLSPATVPDLRSLVLAGEAMSRSHVETWSHIELVNGYGPAESSVAAVVNPDVSLESEATDIGFPCGVRVWLTDADDHNRLVPVGCVGEMLLEGPSLARGYLNNPGKTEESFIFNPAWALQSPGEPPRRFYKTGDLGRYNSNSGSLSYVGRKDTQIKFHGQRIELGEIEHHLAVDESVQHAMVLLPKEGPLDKRLVTVLSLSDPALDGADGVKTGDAVLRLARNPSLTERILQRIRNRLSERLPAYMVPSTWLCVEAIPMLASRKMDRKTVSTWVSSVLTAEQCQEIIRNQHLPEPSSSKNVENKTVVLTTDEAALREIWSLVLNFPADQIDPDDRSFLSLGGDSISAMACASHAKKARLGVSVQDVLKAKSLRQLAAAARPLDQPADQGGAGDEDQKDDAFNAPFDLTPIQQFHFDVRGEAHGDEHFNQSFCLRITRRVKETAVRDAIRIVVKRHPMLRARFIRGGYGQMQQIITPDVESSYRFRTHTIRSRAEADAGIASAQGCLDVRRGPLFAAESFERQDKDEQILFMTIHHLVIDLVSWRVIMEEIEEILNNPSATLTMQRSLPFRKWAALQVGDCADTQLSRVLPSADQVPPSQFAYWGMDNRPNLYGDVACEGFELDTATTTTLIDDCHIPFRTETVDLFLAALIWSFQSTFPDRTPPAMFNEGHGREPPREDIDIARTVGWFTTVFPVALSSPASFAEALIQTKDLRRRVPANGRPYFAARFHTPDGRERWLPHHRRMEVSFNYLGRYQQLERAGALFQPAEGSLIAGEAHPGSPTADFGHAATRFSLFEISAVIMQGTLRFGFAWNGGMQHQDRIHAWVGACRSVLVEAAATLPRMASKITASDLKLLPNLSHADLESFEQAKLAVIAGERGWDAIEDIYPASPIQQGLLLSRTKDGNFYSVRRIFQVKENAGNGTTVDAQRVVQAWKDVARHHALLRTVFVDSISQAEAGSYAQVVLKDVEAPMVVRKCSGGVADILRQIENMEPMHYRDELPQHRFSVFHSDDTVVCVLEMSHAIVDGASMDMLLRDLGRAYAGSLGRLPKPLFSPFVASLQQRNIEADVAFWKTHLAGAEPCHFPVLSDGVNVPEAEKELCTLRVEFPGLAALQKFCSSTGFTLPNAFHAAWALTLACYTNTDDVCFGYLVSGRDSAIEGSEHAIGPFINMATQRVKLSSDGDGQLTLLQLLETVQKDQFDCMPYAQASLAEVQHALNIPGGMALFNTCISYRRLQKSEKAEGSIVCEDVAAIQDPTEYPISVNVETDDEGHAAIDLDYWTDAVASSQAKHVAATFMQALLNIAENAATRISQLDHVHETSKNYIWSWNASMPATTVDCMHRMVEKQVAIRPQAQAIRGWDGDFTYEEMNSLANRLARHLIGLGVGPEVLVPVCFDKSAWTTISMFAVLKAGGGVVPLDATHPASALEGKVSDAGACVVVASEARAGLFETMVPHVVAVGHALLSQLPATDDKVNVESSVGPENPAFIMFTSGSTGKPKGVVLCHQALVSSALAHGGALGLGPHTRFLQFAAHTFDNSIEEMFTNLTHGGCVCVPSDADRLGDLPGAIDRLDANFMDLTPTVAALLRPEQVPKIRGMAVGGEALTREVLDIWGGAVPVHNQYGPSECSINSTHKLHLDKHGDVGNIGTSVGSVSWVVDPKDHNRLVPVGCVGELLIEGPILGRGYLNRPVETAKAFIEMPKWAPTDPQHAQRGSRRMYKTGDLVRYNSDGSLIYLGRKDTQVKLHGQRIELGEIEHHVKTNLPETAQSSVELVTPGQFKKALAVFVCVAPASQDEQIRILPMDASFKSLAQSIIGAVAAQLASYMVPSLFFPVSRMPLTSSGKLDRRQLRTMAEALGNHVTEYRLAAETGGGRAPETSMEKHFQELWAKVLKVPAESISADDSFFTHGGDSVGAMRLAAAARQRGIVVTVANIFQSPKLADMAKTATGGDDAGKEHDTSASTVVEDEPPPGPVEPFSLLKDKDAMSLQDLREQVASICRIDAGSVEDIYPCTPLQAGLVAASQRQPGAYVAVNLYELPTGTDVSRFKKAWQEVVDSETILRTRVVFVEDIGFLQVVVRGAIDWALADSADELSATGHRHLPPHDGGILSRYTVIGEHSNRPTFAWTAHHAVYDGWSLPTLLGRVEEKYRNSETRITPTPHYSRFVEYLSGLDASASDAYWTEKLSGPGATHFPQLPHPGYRIQATSQVTRPVSFTKPKGSNLTMASFLRAAWALVVSIYSSSDDIVFGEIVNGRDVPVSGIEDLVGPTLASIPRRITIDREMSVQQLLADVQAQLNEVIPHQFTGLQRIRALSPATAAASDFKNLLAIDMADDVAEDSLWSNLVGGGNTQGKDFFSLPLNVTCTLGRNSSGAEEILMRAMFDADVVPQWQVVRMLGQFETVLSGLLAPEIQGEKIGEVDLLSADDKLVLREWNSVPGPLVERRVHDMISERLERRGSDATAVVGWDANLSNGELEALSTALAGELVSKGVGANGNRFVPFCFEKSTFAIVAMLAVLKANAAFVPLDPAHPVGRLREIVGDCAATVVLCSPKYESLCAKVVATVVLVDMERLKKLETSQAKSVAEACQPSDAAYVIFTSGTTGKPKGTIISHTAFCSGAAAHGPAMLMKPPFRFLQFASYTFDASLVEILTTLMLGGTVCVPREEDRTNGNIATVMEQMGVTMTLLTPSFARILEPASVPSLRTLILGGEAMAESHLVTWADKLNLVNAYGPSECAVVATVNSKMTRSSNPANLGRGLGRCWIVDPQNHHRLAPLGSVGELLVEGPTLSTGYLKNEAKTRQVLVEDLRWASDAAMRYPDMPSSAPRRMYKTGDLVRVCDDVTGEMVYMGRKDASQAKLNGQRLELDEIVHHLAAHDAVRHAVVILPSTGPCAKRLVAVLSLRGIAADGANNFELVTSKEASSAIDEVQEGLRERLPPYMVPSTWLVLRAIPLLPSGKLDRNSVGKFVEGMTTESLDKVNIALSASQQPDSGIPATPQDMSVDEKLKSIWSQALNIGPERIGRNVSFLHLGGDSITAMQVMAKCRAEGIRVAVSDIIGSKSVHDLALKAGVPKAQKVASVAALGEDHHEFDPAPIQQLYFQLMHVGNKKESFLAQETQFNQSVLLRLTKNTTSHEFGRGLHALVETHSMLRSRFRRDGTGSWRQRITSDASGSYRFKTHVISNPARMEKRIRNSQTALDIQKGPLLAADWFTVGKDKGEVYVFITAHHLVVDVVSWGILLQDLEDFLATGTMKPPSSLSFQTWSRKQSEQAQAEKNGPALLPHHEASDSDLEYWGVAGTPNLHCDVLPVGEVELDTETTSLLLGPECHAPLQTEVLDVLLATLLLSFRNASGGRRGVPTIYNEGHGREAWDDAIDLSRTVGWFTTLYPVHLPDESSSDDDILSAIRWVKDYRKRLAGKGRPYFAYRLLTSQGREEYDRHWPVEVAFNYLGQMQQLTRTDNFLQPFDDGVGQGVNTTSDIGKDVPRLALIEISAVVVGGKMKLSFAYNKHMQHQDSLKRWVKDCQSLLQEAPRRLMQQTQEKTLSAFPLLPLAYYGLESLDQRLREVGVHLQDVEDVYPCSPMQRGLLLSQIRDPEKYGYKAIFQVESSRGEDINLEQLCEAWQAVVRRHSTLRTIFVDTVGDEGLMDQVVLRSAPGRVQILECEDDNAAVPQLEAAGSIDYNEKKPPHRLSVCKTRAGHVFCRLEISHTISDGTSVPILLDDLADAYGKGTISKPVPLYRDYIAYIQSQPRSESIRYWKEYLGGAEPCLFPTLTDGDINAEPSLGAHAITLGDMAKINEYCVNSGITLSTLLQFVWALVVRSYTGSDEVLFGYLASGRDIPVANIDQAVGAFINMLVCRLQLPAATEVGEALDAMRTDLANAMAHQSCSLAEMQHELKLTTATLFNTAFTYQKRTEVGQGNPQLPECSLQYRVLNAEDPSEYAVAVNVEAMDKAVEVHFSYWKNVVSDAQMKNIAATFEQAVSDLITDAADDRTVGELNLVGSAGIEQIQTWNDYELPRVEQCVHDIFEQHVLQRPDSPAVCGWDASFTYRELDRAATALARYLVAAGGVGPEVFVPLCFEKSAWTVVAQIAVLKAGGAFVNLDPSHPDSRLESLIQDVDAKFVLCSAKHKAKMDRIASNTFVVDAESVLALNKAAASAAAPFRSAAQPSNPAYIIFTSGTTGKPKGTVIEHGAFCTGGLAHAKAMFMHSDSRVLQFASYTFDASIMETLSCLLVGGCVCVPSDEDRMNDVAAVIRNMGVTWTLLTPSVAGTVKPESVTCLKTLVTGGEAMAPGHIERWGTQCALVNAYGPTECSVVATTSTKVDESHKVCNTDRSNIGPAVGGRVWVTDPATPDRLVPVGAVGELVVEGRLVARGYLNNKEQTAKAFIQSPAWTKNAGFPKSMWRHADRMYRTGDLVRYNSDGSISYISRKDTQIKLNGRRIELGEIEFHCRTGLPDDAQSAVEVVLPPNNRAQTKSLAVFFNLPNSKATAPAFSLLPMSESVRKLALSMETHLTAHLPSYMVPQLFVPVSTMPWTSAGKLDRRQLRQALEGASRETVAGYRLSAAAAAARHRGPTSETEKTLQRLWESVLGLPAGSVGAADSFFRLGGDSLTAMRLVGAARAHKIVLTVLDVFDKPVLADMARACGGEDVTAAPVPELKPFDLVQQPTSEIDVLIEEISNQCNLPRTKIQDVYPCSPLQEGLVTLASKQAGAYVAVNTLRLPAQVDLDHFKAAWQEVVDETDTLRTRILHTAAFGFLQVVVAPEPIQWHDESSLEEAVIKGQALGLRTGGSLTRYAIVDGPDGRHFAWGIHHALYDGWSLRLLARRVQEVYNHKVLGTREDNTTPRLSYANFIHYLSSRDIAASEKFWQDALDGASSITHFPQLPTAIQNEAPSFRAETRRVNINRSGILIDITAPTLIRAAWAIVQAAYTGMDDVIFGETLAGRNIDVLGITEMAGPTFTTVPTRVPLARDSRVVEFLQTLHSMASRVVPHQHLGLQNIQRLNSDGAAACAFQNLLVIQASSAAPPRQEKLQQHAQEADWDFQGGSSTDSFFTHPLVLECAATDTAIETTFHYNEKVLSPWQAKRLVHQFEAVLKRLVEKSASKDATLADIHAISPEDQALIARWNRTSTLEEVNSCIHDLFLEQASAQPQRVGISAWDAELTHGEIREFATRLALRLKQTGVAKETLVPVCLERSAWSVVILIGILMAGGAFVPLDPAHPLSRQKEVLESIQPRLIVCSPEHASRFSGIVETRLSVDGDVLRSLPPSGGQTLPAVTTPSNTAYVLFTSGSTGRPKGVVVAHRDFCSSSLGFSRATNMTASSRVFHFSSLTFDVALMEVLSPLTLGACVCVPTAYERLHDLGSAIVRLRATWAFLTPSVANLLDPDVVCPTFKTLVCGGEAMQAETVARWADRLELMNGYGPTEASVLAVINPHVSTEKDHTIIGRGHSASRLWIVDPSENCNDRLTPVGAIGELAISGPLLARGYLDDPVKTAKAFIENPGWAKKELLAGAAPSARIYRTGDLVRYRSDGAIEFVGRRDGQVKVNGQRIELGDIESHLSADRHVRLAAVVQPKKGPCKKQLVGVVTLASTNAGTTTSGECQPMNGSPEQMKRARADISEIRARLADSLPHYMVPALWIVLEAMPVVVSGKLDRKRVAAWVEGLDDVAYERIANSLGLGAGESGVDEGQVTGSVKVLRDIWAKELNLPQERIKLNQPFLGLGGDSIRAMGVVSRARNAGMKLSIQDVLRCKSVIQLGQIAKVLPSATSAEAGKGEETEQPFALSPIQSMYLRSAVKHVGEARFNQSFTLGVPRRISIDIIKKAIDSVVQRHAMLRARFTKTQDGRWEQRIAKMGPSTYTCLEHRLSSRDEMPAIMATAQTSLCIERGPVFRVDLLDTAGTDEIVISMIAHHLSVDMVSWRVIVQDLTQVLETGSLSADVPLSFRSWCAQQAAHDKTLDPGALLPFKETQSDLGYWGAKGPLTYGRTETEVFSLGESTTEIALGECHEALRSEPVDLFLAAIAHSFAKTFRDRNVPTVHVENHGREAPEGSNVDLSRTVGWFTAICPLVIPVRAAENDVIDTLRRTKDVRRSVPAHGRPYFAHKHLAETAESSWFPMEVLFNYLGGGVGVQQQEQSDSLVREVDLDDIEGLDPTSIADVGPETRRLAMFEISAMVVNNRLQFSFAYDSSLSLASDVRRWIGACKNTLEEMARSLVQRPAELTLSDYPLLPLTYDSLRTLTEVTLPRVGIDRASVASRVEDIYPCTPVQEGMLISQLRNPNAYIFHAIYTVRHNDPRREVDAKKIAKAWQEIVDRHAALRTVFIESARRGAVFDQVVLRSADSGAVLISCSDEDAMDRLSQVTMRHAKQPQLPQRLAVCTTYSGKVLVKLEVNHAALDGGSLAIVLEELASGYMGRLDISPAPLYRDYVQYIRALPAGEDSAYWMKYLNGLRPCYFPNITASTTTLASESRSLRAVSLQFDRYAELRRLSEQTHVTLANIMHAAWAFVLRKYTGCDDVCFGYLTAGRDAPVENIGRTVGTLINMLCCRVQISRTQTLEDILRVAQDQQLESVPFQHCSLARVQHELGLAGKPLYNTSISTQNHSDGEGCEVEETISFEMEKGHDPSEYAITVNIETTKNSEGVVLRYWSDHVSDDQAQEVANSLTRVLNALINRPALPVAELDFILDGKTAAATSSAEDLLSPGSPRSMDLESSPRTSIDNSVNSPLNGPAGQTPYEKTLLALWSALLSLPEDSITGEDSFFDLGGDSITAMKLAGEARDHGLPLTVADVFRSPTFDGMAATLRASADLQAINNELEKQEDGTATTRTSTSDSYERFSLLAASNVDAFLQTSIVPQVCVFRGGISDVLPATDFQSLSVAGALLESRWMLNYFYLDGNGPLNVGQLKRACFRLVQALDILRTVFVPSGGRFLQVVLRTLRPAFHVVETDEPMDEFSVESQNSEPRLGEPFVEFTVVKHRLSSRHRLYLRISHAQYDGVCFPKILSALQAAYKGEAVPRPPSFANYLRASAGSLTSEHYQHWKQLLAGSSMTEIVRRDGPYYHRNASGATTACLKKTVHLPPVESGHITTATVVKAAWAYVLAQVSASDDVVFGHTISGRNAAVEGVGNMVGPCLNMVPVRVQFGSGPGWTARQLLRQVQDQQIANMSHEVLGFREIIRHCTSWPHWTYFASTVQHQNVDQGGKLRLGDVEYGVGCASVAQEDFADLSVLSQPLAESDKYEIMLSFAEGGAISREFAERALDLLCEAARLFAANPETELPSASELSCKPRQVPFEEARETNSNEDETAARLEHLSLAQLTDLQKQVSTSWRQVLGLNTDTQTTGPNNETEPIDEDTTFFTLGGDIIGLAQLAWLLSHQQQQQQQKTHIRLEELVEHPTLRGHMALLARAIPAPSDSTAADSQKQMQKAATFPMVGKLPRVDSGLKLAKALGLVKKRFTMGGVGVKKKGREAVTVAAA